MGDSRAEQHWVRSGFGGTPTDTSTRSNWHSGWRNGPAIRQAACPKIIKNPLSSVNIGRFQPFLSREIRRGISFAIDQCSHAGGNEHLKRTAER
jgi:hypothetical protein